MTIEIDADEVRELAARLADMRHCSIEDAVRSALSEALAKETEIAEKRARARPILEKIWAAPKLRPDFRDHDLYDENGRPIL